MTDTAIIEAAARATRELFDAAGTIINPDWMANGEAVLTVVTPLIRAAALEEAAVVAENEDGWPRTTAEIAATIRALKEKP